MKALKNLEIKFNLTPAFGLTTLIFVSLSGAILYILKEMIMFWQV